MAINYRTITPQRMAAPDTSGAAAQRGAQTGFAIGAQIRARIDAARAIEKANQAAKDKWRDSQMATITDTSFVDKVDPSIHEGAFSWLKGKQQEYGDVLDALSAEGMNSKNPAWAELNNQKIRIEASFNNFSTNLDNFKKSRQTAIDMRSPNGGEGYNEVAKTFNSENALGFLVDRQFGAGYGDMEINDDGSFNFPETNYDGKPIGSDNLPTLTAMPYDQQNNLIKNELAYGAEIKNGTYDIKNEANNNRIRNEILTQFRGMKTDQLQAYLLNDMDGEGGTPAFISDLAPGENPTFTWNDVYGKEQSMDYQNLMTNKDAMISFATSKEYEGTIDYMKTMVPDTGKEDNEYLNRIATAREETHVRETDPDAFFEKRDIFGRKLNDEEAKDYPLPIGEEYPHIKREEQSNMQLVERLMDDYNKSISVYPYTNIIKSDDAFQIYSQNQVLAGITGADGKPITAGEAREKFDKRYGGSMMFTVDNRNGLTSFRGDISDDQAIYNFLKDKELISPADRYGVK